MKRFDWPPKEYVNLTIDTDVSRGYVLVTGASENHFKYVLLKFKQFISEVQLGYIFIKTETLKNEYVNYSAKNRVNI